MDVLEQTAGATLVTAGLWMIAPPVAIIVLGVLIGIHGFLLELKHLREKEHVDGSREPDSVDDTTRHS